MRAGVILRVQPGRVVSELLRGRELSRLNRELQKADPGERPSLDSERAVACANCPALYHADGGPCPRCGSHQAVPVARAINGTKNETEATS